MDLLVKRSCSICTNPCSRAVNPYRGICLVRFYNAHMANKKLKFPYPVLLAEAAGTGLLLLVGLSFVILDFGSGSPVLNWLPDPAVRRLVTGFLFGATGGLIAVSPLGKLSGAHLNPVVTFAFWVQDKLQTHMMAAYILVQFAGAALGSLPLLLWGSMGRSVNFGATIPGGGYSTAVVLSGEALCTGAMILGLFFFLSRQSLRRFTPLLFPFLYAILVFLEAPISGTSTNPARSFGPALLASAWQGWWIYWLGPLVGTLLALVLIRSNWLGVMEVEVAKLYHFGHDPYKVFHWLDELEDEVESVENEL
jgi:aquaporin Z